MLENFWWPWWPESQRILILQNVGVNWVSGVKNWVWMLGTFWDICFALVIFFDRQKNPNQSNPKLRIQNAKNLQSVKRIWGVVFCSYPWILCFLQHIVTFQPKFKWSPKHFPKQAAKLLTNSTARSGHQGGERERKTQWQRTLYETVSYLLTPWMSHPYLSMVHCSLKEGSTAKQKSILQPFCQQPVQAIHFSCAQDCLSLPKAHFLWSWGWCWWFLQLVAALSHVKSHQLTLTFQLFLCLHYWNKVTWTAAPLSNDSRKHCWSVPSPTFSVFPELQSDRCHTPCFAGTLFTPKQCRYIQQWLQLNLFSSCRGQNITFHFVKTQSNFLLCTPASSCLSDRSFKSSLL